LEIEVGVAAAAFCMCEAKNNKEAKRGKEEKVSFLINENMQIKSNLRRDSPRFAVSVAAAVLVKAKKTLLLLLVSFVSSANRSTLQKLFEQSCAR